MREEVLMANVEDETPMVVDSSTTICCSTHIRKPNPKYANLSTTVEWATCSNLELLEASAAEAHRLFLLSSDDAHTWEPAPRTIRGILKMPDSVVKSAWLAAVRKELKALVDAHTFIIDSMLDGEVSFPAMEILK